MITKSKQVNLLKWSVTINKKQYSSIICTKQTIKIQIPINLAMSLLLAQLVNNWFR
jgi:hypothetical protein